MSTFASQLPTGTVDGSNTLFTITLNTSSLTGFELYKNGILLGSNVDFTWTQALGTATITTAIPPEVGDIVNSWIWQQ